MSNFPSRGDNFRTLFSVSSIPSRLFSRMRPPADYQVQHEESKEREVTHLRADSEAHQNGGADGGARQND